ncbi:MAG: response regulator [Candidatus Omnitrophica bacterium]|nr:response regulator [Candidatus Omnitrophota bacterium]
MSKILIVDDEVEVVEFFKNFLKRKGFKAFTATEAQSALEIFDAENPQLVLLDVKMPGEDGFYILEHIRNSSHDTKVIMITAKDDKESIVRAKKFGVIDYLVKPIELESLDTLIGKYMN